VLVRRKSFEVVKSLRRMTFEFNAEKIGPVAKKLHEYTT
jgi:hypothetical protein